MFNTTPIISLACYRWDVVGLHLPFFPRTSAFPCCGQLGREAHLCSLLTAAVSVCSAACRFRCFKCHKILSRSFSPAINHASHLGAGVPCNPQLAQTFLDTVPATRLCLSEFSGPRMQRTPCCRVLDCLWGTFAQSYPAGLWVGGGGLFQLIGPWLPHDFFWCPYDSPQLPEELS